MTARFGPNEWGVRSRGRDWWNRIWPFMTQANEEGVTT